MMRMQSGELVMVHCMKKILADLRAGNISPVQARKGLEFARKYIASFKKLHQMANSKAPGMEIAAQFIKANAKEMAQVVRLSKVLSGEVSKRERR